MYYNNKFKILIKIVSIITILTGIIAIAKPNFRMVMMPIMFIILGLQQLLIGVNSFKLNKKTESILSIGASIFTVLCSIISIKLMVP